MDPPGILSGISPRDRLGACEKCNRRKKRCDAGKPRCQLCIRSGTECTYPMFRLKPGPRKGMRNVENSTGDDHVQRQESATGKRKKMRRTSRDKGLGAADSPSQVTISSRSGQQASDAPGNRWTNFDMDSLTTTSPATSPAECAQLNNPLLPPKNIIIHLVDVFFDAVQPQFRLLHRPSFVGRLGSGLLLSDKHSVLLLNAMFALSARYSNDPRVELFDLSLLHGSGYNETLDQTDCRERQRWERGKGFARRARELFQKEIAMTEMLETETERIEKSPIMLLQVAALLGFAELGLGPNSRAYSSISTCVRMAYDCGLNAIDAINYPNLVRETQDAPSGVSDWVRQEELRRVWWCIWDLEIFVCGAKCRPRMIDVARCETKLPVDDQDWFEEREIPSSFLPGNLCQLREFLDGSPRLSVLAQRIVSCHLLSMAVEMVHTECIDEYNESCSLLQRCASSWERCFSGDLRSQQMIGGPTLIDRLPMYIFIQQISLLIGKARMFQDATPTTIANYCQLFSERKSQAHRDSELFPGFQAFVKALTAADTICTIVRDWPSHVVPRSSPFISCVLWGAACIQLLVKTFAGSCQELAERASLSLRILTLAMEESAEYWALGQSILSSFQRYERSLINCDYSNEGDGHYGLITVLRVISLPSFVDGAFMAAKPTSINAPKMITEIIWAREFEALLHPPALLNGDSWLTDPETTCDRDFLQPRTDMEDRWMNAVGYMV